MSIITSTPASSVASAPAPTKSRGKAKPITPAPTEPAAPMANVTPTTIHADRKQSGRMSLETAAATLATLTPDEAKALGNGSDRARADQVREAQRQFCRALCAPATDGGGSGTFGVTMKRAIVKVALSDPNRTREKGARADQASDSDIIAYAPRVTLAQFVDELIDPASAGSVAARAVMSCFSQGVRGLILSVTVTGGTMPIGDARLTPQWAIPALVCGRGISASKVRRAL